MITLKNVGRVGFSREYIKNKPQISLLVAEQWCNILFSKFTQLLDILIKSNNYFWTIAIKFLEINSQIHYAFKQLSEDIKSE